MFVHIYVYIRILDSMLAKLISTSNRCPDVDLTYWDQDKLLSFRRRHLEGIFLNGNVLNSIKVSPKFVSNDLINNNPALIQIMAWRRTGDKSLSDPLMA